MFYVDPESGDDQAGDGSQGNPWASIQFVVESRVNCVDADGNPKHTDAPIEAGDTIVLVGASGHDQEIDISGCFNADYVTIRSQNLHEATVANIPIGTDTLQKVSGTSHTRSIQGARKWSPKKYPVVPRHSQKERPQVKCWFKH